ncbi:hypothetical protein SUGI_0238740 [Cryptomeria japonica]|nr:hypothetical protein SUGI_0238740 [Cryptomeria japonica]
MLSGLERSFAGGGSYKHCFVQGNNLYICLPLREEQLLARKPSCSHQNFHSSIRTTTSRFRIRDNGINVVQYDRNQHFCSSQQHWKREDECNF